MVLLTWTPGLGVIAMTRSLGNFSIRALWTTRVSRRCMLPRSGKGRKIRGIQNPPPLTSFLATRYATLHGLGASWVGRGTLYRIRTMRTLRAPEPEFSEEARRVKFQGDVTLAV